MIYNKNVMKNAHERKKTDFNLNNEIKYLSNANKTFNTISNNNNNYKLIKYVPINSKELINFYLHNRYNNNLKVYKSKIKRKDHDYNKNY